MNRRVWEMSFFCLIVSFIFIGTAVCISDAAERKYPSRPVDVYNPFAPGGPVDAMNRLIVKKLEANLGGTFVAQSKAGGGGAILASYLANARPDGYTLGNISAFHIGVPILQGNATYSFKDFHIIGQLVVFPSVLVVPADSQFKTFQDLIEYAKKTPVKYGHPGVASTIFMRFENLFTHLGMKMDNIPFSGDSETVAAVLGKHVAVGGMSAGTAKGLVEAGKVRCLFIFENPTDFGLPADTTNLRGLLRGAPFTDIEPSQLLVVHSKTPPEIIQALEGAYAKIIKDEEFKKLVESLNLGIGYMNGKTFTEKLPANMKILEQIMRNSGQLK
jgi:tripartite-type tricarboxylate transporter receptor subunit TctC